MTTRGFRNNNPGNLRTGAKWRGLSGESGGFCVFISDIYGLRALAKLLIGYQTRHDLNTIGGIIDRFAPPVENDTNSYASHVADRLNVGVDEAIDVTDLLTMHKLIEAIVLHENGSQPYSGVLIADAIVLATI